MATTALQAIAEFLSSFEEEDEDTGSARKDVKLEGREIDEEIVGLFEGAETLGHFAFVSPKAEDTKKPIV